MKFKENRILLTSKPDGPILIDFSVRQALLFWTEIWKFIIIIRNDKNKIIVAVSYIAYTGNELELYPWQKFLID